MASELTIDFEALLKPIPNGDPAGKDLRYEGSYDAIQKARRADDGLPQGDWKREVKVANWREVAKLATEALSTKSKDLQIAAWLTEALVKEHGFAGLRDGLRLLRELQERFWDSLYPRPEADDFEIRAGALEGLNDRLPPIVLDVPINVPIQQRASGVEVCSFLRYQESRAVDELGRKDPKAMQAVIADGKLTGEQFDKAVGASRRAFYESLFDDLNESLKEYEKLAAAAEAKFGPKVSPSLLTIQKALDDCRSLVEKILKKKRELEPDLLPQGNGADAAAPQVEGARPTEPQNRADALRRLEAIASFFLRTEPQSPVAYLVQRAVRWGQMPLEDWLTDVIRDPGVLSHLRETLGIKNSGEKAG